MQELEETAYWLELLEGARFCGRDQLEPLANEADQLMAIFVTIVRKTKAALRKPDTITIHADRKFLAWAIKSCTSPKRVNPASLIMPMVLRMRQHAPTLVRAMKGEIIRAPDIVVYGVDQVVAAREEIYFAVRENNCDNTSAK